MKEIFKDILEIESVEGVMFFSPDGELIHQQFSTDFPPTAGHGGHKVWWAVFFDALKGVREADAVYEDRRIYIRNTGSGFLAVVMEIYAPIALVRLNCDIVLPSLKKKKASRGLMGFFRKN